MVTNSAPESHPSDSPAPSRPRVVAPGDVNADLGLGRVVAERSRGRFVGKGGGFTSRRLGLDLFSSLSLYHWLVTLPWPAFFGLVAVAFLGVNLVFAALYVACGPVALSGDSRVVGGRFMRDFFFSVQTLSTVGYGHIAPMTLAANLVVTLESFVGLLGVALATGLLFARFAKPVSRVLFSRNALVAPYGSGRGLMFRITNGLRTEIIDLSAQVTFSRFEAADGVRSRRFYPLALERPSVALFPLAWTVVHPITEGSPLWGVSPADLFESEAEILVVLRGTDDELFQPLHARGSYAASEIVWDARFVDLYVRDGPVIAIDVRRLHDYEPVKPPEPLPAAP